MAIVNFSIPQELNRQVMSVIKTRGFASRAEFFRVAAMNYIVEGEKTFRNEDERFDYLSKKLAQEVSRRFKGKKLPSVREQLKDL